MLLPSEPGCVELTSNEQGVGSDALLSKNCKPMNMQHQAVPNLAPEVSQGTCAHILQADVAVRAAPTFSGRQLGQEARQVPVFLCHTGNRFAREQEIVDRLHMPSHQRSHDSCVYVYQIPHHRGESAGDLQYPGTLPNGMHPTCSLVARA